MKVVRKWRAGVFWEWEGMKNAEQWCFSIGGNSERLLVTMFQQRGERQNRCWTELF
jgi:hypothetical protein